MPAKQEAPRHPKLEDLIAEVKLLVGRLHLWQKASKAFKRQIFKAILGAKGFLLKQSVTLPPFNMFPREVDKRKIS